MKWWLLLVLAIAACSPMIYTHGVPNLHQVDSSIWRSGQIVDQEGWDWIAGLATGRKVHVIKLNFANEGSDALALNMKMKVYELSIQPEGDQDLWDDFRSVYLTPDMGKVDLAQNLLLQCYRFPTTDFCLVHCTHGQDRTGFVIGIHRLKHNHWTKDAAYAEMRHYHFHPELHGIHEAWERF